ncbi:MAG TPA: trimeric intracellular cation channel family protein [Gelidibacter sp.]|uniref:trimeric intracellular cation channel family protein n=1 Tax=Gelidibacter sp. TaxID=2018083 RepID=UPI002CC242E0|nr:trimeric intracellular cation channel family protein [Gelidibacter sp.]HXJ99375.1 trimeric intracellular cation channel family protein [Gelidibacter sp.]
MFIQTLDILGTIAFAISGVSVAMNKRMDAFGVLIIAFVTAVGGGTLRDVLIGVTPVTWMTNMTYVYVIFGATVFTVVFQQKINYLRTSLLFFDSIGIGLYTVVGIEKGLAVGLHPIICISLGTMTACFGGVIRDILCNEIPVIFRRKEIYATACILGGIVYFVLRQFPISDNIIFMSSGAVVIVVRLLAVRFGISLPNIYRKERSV